MKTVEELLKDPRINPVTTHQKAHHPDPRTEQQWEHCADVRDSLLVKLRELDVALEAAWPLLNGCEHWDEVLTRLADVAEQYTEQQKAMSPA